MKNFLVRVLIACFTGVSFQAQAGLIGTGEVAIGVQQAQVARTRLVAGLQEYGIGADAARDRVATLSDAEAVQLAGRIAEAPAGAAGVFFGMLAVLIFLIWRFGFSDQAKAEHKAKESAKKQ